jgi:Domain of unknown function (DUF4349)
MKELRIFAILLFAITAACAGATSPNLESSQKQVSREPAKPATEATSVMDKLPDKAADPLPPVIQERKIIRNGELTLEADLPEEAQRAISTIVESKGGFVIESQQSSSELRGATRDTVTMKVRVPAEKFNEAIDEIRKTGSRVIVETVKGQDVTEEFVDIEARLKAKKLLETQIMEIMKRSNSVEDALSVQKELGTVRGEIEQIEGRKRFLENQSSLSTITLRIQTPTALTAGSTGFFYRLGEAFSTGYNAALTFILFLVTLLIAVLPFLLLIVLPLFLIARYLIKRRPRASKSILEIAKEEIKTD